MAAQTGVAETIVVNSVTIRVLVQAEVPAEDTGVMTTLNVRPGDKVSAGQIIGTLNDKEAKIALAEATTQHAIALKDVESDLTERSMGAALKQEIAALKRYEVNHLIAVKKANNDVLIRLAQEDRKIALAELSRAQKSKAAFSSSVSQAEIDRLQTTYDRQVLQIEKEERDQAVAKMTQDAEKAALDQQLNVKDKAQLDLDLTKHETAVARMALALREQAMQLAKIKLDRRAIKSPINGIVVEQFRNQGEWVEPGVKVVRVLGLDRLQAEGFINSKDAQKDLRGSKVELTVNINGKSRRLNGKVSFVSPEVDSVNKQVRISVDVPNQDGLLRPGMTASMVIHPKSADQPSHIRERTSAN